MISGRVGRPATTGSRAEVLELSLPGRLDAIPAAVERIVAFVAESGCAPGEEFEIEVALDEALANAVKHGCHLDPDKSIRVEVRCDSEDGVLIVVRDPGSGFDALAIPDPIAERSLFASSGRGVFLIRRLMDEVEFEDGGCEIRMRKWPRAQSGEH